MQSNYKKKRDLVEQQSTNYSIHKSNPIAIHEYHLINKRIKYRDEKRRLLQMQKISRQKRECARYSISFVLARYNILRYKHPVFIEWNFIC